MAQVLIWDRKLEHSLRQRDTLSLFHLFIGRIYSSSSYGSYWKAIISHGYGFKQERWAHLWN